MGGGREDIAGNTNRVGLGCFLFFSAVLQAFLQVKSNIWGGG